MWANFSHNSFSGTPCCRPMETAQAKLSIRPLTVEPSLAMVMKISPGIAVLVEADGEVAFVSADGELVGDGETLFGQTYDGWPWAARPARRWVPRAEARSLEPAPSTPA